ncbi:MAG: hypothetical protein KJ958_13955 [Gammaproteobacteria bacterium]|nr:hypothetical protein [Gammaproteobacteria bacterium]MBU1980265.1 hypothetical protein [Gammaproteobacteria bacterium]
MPPFFIEFSGLSVPLERGLCSLKSGLFDGCGTGRSAAVILALAICYYPVVARSATATQNTKTNDEKS